MITTTMLQRLKVLKQSNDGRVRFSKVDDKDIDFEAEEKKAQRRLKSVKLEKVRRSRIRTVPGQKEENGSG